jgi:hypothetical protein
LVIFVIVEGEVKTEFIENVHACIQNEPVALIREELQKLIAKVSK